MRWRLEITIVFILALCVPFVCFSQARENKLIGYWSFDEYEGASARDASGNGHNGEISGAQRIEGVKEGALYFPGKAFVRIPNHSDFDMASAITIIAWIMPATLSEHELKIISRAKSSTVGYDIGIHSAAGLFARVGAAGNGDLRTLAINGLIKVDKWQQVAVTYDGANSRLFLNGKKVCEKVIGGESGLYPTDFFIGKPADRDDLFFKGAIDEVKIFNYALEEDEIKEEYQDVAWFAPLDAEISKPQQASTVPDAFPEP